MLKRNSSYGSSNTNTSATASTTTTNSSIGSQSPFFAPRPPKHQLLTTPNGSITQVRDVDQESKSSILGAAFNIVNNIAGAAIVGIPFAISQCSLLLGTIMVAFIGLMTVKSLRLLVETAKHVDVPSYERLAEASFGKSGFTFISIAMFIIAYGATVGYLIIIKSNLSDLLGVDDDDVVMKNAALTISSLMILYPISLQRDMSNLSKTSTISVIFVFILVGIIVVFSPQLEEIEDRGGINVVITESEPDINTFFIGIGVLCFAFVCQHSAFIIASSLERPTRKRWNTVTALSITTCVILAIIMGVGGYLGFMADTDGDILVNLSKYAAEADAKTKLAATIAQALLCMTMFFVYPMDLFVARHVCVVLFFNGRRAHEGDDHAVLARKDRRVAVTTGLYLFTLLPALIVDDLGKVFSLSGALGGATLSYMGPGLMYIAVHGAEFLDRVEKSWGSNYVKNYTWTKMQPNNDMSDLDFHIQRSRYGGKIAKQNDRKNVISQCCDYISWHIFIMPLWCRIAAHGKKMLQKHEEIEALKSPFPRALGKINHKKPHYIDLLKRRNERSQSPTNNLSHGVDDKSMARVTSLPAILQPINSAASLNNIHSFEASTSTSKKNNRKKVGFVPQDSLGKELAINEKELLLNQYRPVSADSFSAASFEVIRSGSGYGAISGSDTIFEDENDDVKHILESHSPFFVEDQDDVVDIGLDLGQESHEKAKDVELQSSTHISESYDDDYREDDSNSSSVFVEEEVDDEMYQSDCTSDASSVRVSPSPVPNATLTTVSTYSKYNTSKVGVNPIVSKKIQQKGSSIVSIVKASPNTRNEIGEDDPQSDPPSVLDFVIAIFFVLFGFLAGFAGVFSIMNS